MLLLPCPQCKYFFKDLQVRFPRSSVWDGNLDAVNFMEGLLLRGRSWGRPGRVAGRHEVGIWSQLQADSTGSAEAWNHHIFGPITYSKKQAFLPMPAMWDASKGWGRWQFGAPPPRMRWCCSQSLGWPSTIFLPCPCVVPTHTEQTGLCDLQNTVEMTVGDFWSQIMKGAVDSALLSLGLPVPRETSLNIERKLKQSYEEVTVTRKQGLLPTALWVSPPVKW